MGGGDGMTGLQLVVTLVTTLLGGGFLGVLFKYLTDRRRLELEGDNSLNAQLTARVTKLETDLDLERARRERVSASNDAWMAVMRHRLNNATQCLDALLLLLEQAPDKAAEAVARIREMRTRQAEAEALEKAAVTAAQISATGPDFEMGDPG